MSNINLRIMTIIIYINIQCSLFGSIFTKENYLSLNNPVSGDGLEKYISIQHVHSRNAN